MQTKVDKYGVGYVKIKYRINKYDFSLFRSIKVYKEGKIEEKESSSNSEFNRWRVIYQSGFWEEYSIDFDIGFGIRKVVYPDGQQFTNEVYSYNYDNWTWGWKEIQRWWNAIGEETYAIQNDSIPYLLGNNEMKKYRFVTEDGSFNIIDLRLNYKKESLSLFSSSSSCESSDSNSD